MVQFADAFRLPFPAAKIGNRFGVHDIENGRDLYGQQGHRGVDFKVGAGAAIPAIANGVVERVMWSDALGNITVLRHYLHGDNNDVYSGYCHQSNVQVKVGQAVRLGATIGHTGATGSQAYGPHLHLTLSRELMGVEYGDVFDPIGFIEEHLAAASKPKPAPNPTPQPVFTTARPGEGLWAIGQRSGHVALATMKRLNSDIVPPNYIVQLGAKIRVK